MPKHIAISERTVFLDKNGVRASRGISADKLARLIESELIWVFNIGLKKHERNLRFWLPEILDARAVANLRLDEVISKVLPLNRRSINGSEIAQWFLLSRTTVQRLGRQVGGVVKSGLLQVDRERLGNWLRQRWIGGQA